jgi:small subunit ribosomal protein S17
MAEKTNNKLIRGVVVSDKMDKSVVVSVARVKTHPLYHKNFTVNKRYKAHDSENSCKNGDVVEISQVKPMSKNKTHIVIRKIS